MVSVHDTAKALRDAGIEDAAFDARILHEIANGDSDALATLTQRRIAHYPLQYLCGSWDFLDFTLAIGEGVLIPRADTEIVAEHAISATKKALHHTEMPHVVDLCAGSGALAIGIARFVPQCSVTAVELSADALPYLRQNVTALAPRVQVCAGDIFTWQQKQPTQSIDVLVSNPPYITSAEMHSLAPELAFEPHMALHAHDNGLAFYRHIAHAYRPLMREGGTIVFEIGATQGDAVIQILTENSWHDAQVYCDYGANPRCVIAQK